MLENPMYLADPDEPLPCPGNGLCPITCKEARRIYAANGKKPFSFMMTAAEPGSKPYIGLKTIMAIHGYVAVAPPAAGRGRLAPK